MGALLNSVVFDHVLAPEHSTSRDEISYDATTLADLAALPPFEYDRRREAEAERLGIRISTLDAEVNRHRREREPDGAGRDVAFDDSEPWHDQVDGPELLTSLSTAVQCHLVLPPGAAEAVALWIVHAHSHDTASISPILAVTSPTPECGKTTLLTLLGALVPRPLPASNVTSAALFRAIEKWHPTVLVDEADTFLKDKDDLRGVLNSGHNRHAAWVIRTTGDNHEPRRFKTWAPKAIAMIGRLPATLDSRAIHIELRRIADGERVEPLRGDRLAHLKPLSRKARRWALDNAHYFSEADPIMPSTLRGRAADNWRHLLAIADVARGDWPKRARQAAETLCARGSEPTAGIMLLEDVQALFVERGTDRLGSADIVTALGCMEDRPWPEWKGGKPITLRQLAKLLEPFGVAPKTVRLSTGTPKGYLLGDFEEPFRRYLPKPSATPPQASRTSGLQDNICATIASAVADAKSA